MVLLQTAPERARTSDALFDQQFIQRAGVRPQCRKTDYSLGINLMIPHWRDTPRIGDGRLGSAQY